MEDRVKELLDRARDAAVTVGDAAGAAVWRAGKAAGQVVDAARVNLDIFQRRTDVNGLLREVGILVYEAHRGGDTDSEALAAKLAEIDRKLAETEELRGRADLLRNSRPCPVCGASCGREDKFCKHCGEAL